MTESDPLLALAHAANAARLSPADEERATALLKERLLTKRAGIDSAVPAMIDGLPWVVCVNAVSAVWEQLTAPMRRHLLGSIAKNESESAQRLRLSLARAIFKLEPATGLKLAAQAAAELKNPETGTLTAKLRQYFFNVFIGKGKPWLLQLPLADLKSAEADALVHCAIQCLPICPPPAQLSVLRWADGTGRLKKAKADDLDVAAKAVSRWNSRYQRQLRAEIAELPPALEAVLKPEARKPQERKPEPEKKQPAEIEKSGEERKPEAHGGKAKKSRDPAISVESVSEDIAAIAPPTESQEPAVLEATASVPIEAGEEAAIIAPPEELFIPGRAERLAKKAEQKRGEKRQEPGRPERERGRERPERGKESPKHGAEHPKGEPEHPKHEHAVEHPKHGPELRHGKPAEHPFDLKQALHGVEQYVATLRAELEQTKAQLRRVEKEGKGGRRAERTERVVEKLPPAELEALARHNARLEETVADLRAQLEDLASHHESVAESRLLHTGEPLPEGSAEQLRALLSIKLAESYETYQAMRLEPLDKVFRLDYRDLLGSVFEVLQGVGVKLKKGSLPDAFILR